MASKLNPKRQATLEAIFQSAVPTDIRWSDIEALVVALGGEKSERRGSRVAFALEGAKAVFHKPHPKPVAGKGLVRSLRRFLIHAGVMPWQP